MMWLIINGLTKKRKNKLIDLNGDQTLFQLSTILEIAGQGFPDSRTDGRSIRGHLLAELVLSVIWDKLVERYYDAFDNNLLERVIIIL